MNDSPLLFRVNAPYMQELDDAARRVLSSGVYLRGSETANLEALLAQTGGHSHCVGTASGLDALRLTIRALIDSGRLHPGDEVMTCAHTYIASLLPLTEFGLIPKLIDAAPGGFAPAPGDWEAAIGSQTRGALVVHLYGMPAATNATIEALRRRGLVVIEDCAQAIGAMSEDSAGTMRPTGYAADAAAFSFYPTKNIGALGDAGAVGTDDAALSEAVRTLTNYGSDRRYHNITRGYNSRIDELQAAFVATKLRYLDDITAARRATAEAYSESIAHPEIRIPQELKGTRAAWHQYVVRTGRRDALREYLLKNGVETDIHYPTPAFRQPCYAGCFPDPMPQAEQLAKEVLSLPLAATSPAEARRIAEIINSFE